MSVRRSAPALTASTSEAPIQGQCESYDLMSDEEPGDEPGFVVSKGYEARQDVQASGCTDQAGAEAAGRQVAW